MLISAKSSRLKRRLFYAKNSAHNLRARLPLFSLVQLLRLSSLNLKKGIITSRNGGKIKDFDRFGEHCIIPAHTYAFAEMV